VSHPFFTLVVGPEVKMKKRKLSKIGRDIYEKRTAVIYLILALVFSGLLRSGDQFTTLLLIYTATFWVYTYIELRRKYHRPRDPETKATLRVSTEPFVDWAVTTMQGELVVSGLGNRTVSLPNTGDHVEREMKVKFSEFVYVVEVTSGNGDAFVSLTVDGDDEFLQTVACGRSGDPEVLYTHLNTGYGTKHWLIPGFMQGIPV
jgi:hypothetical protein